MTREEKIAALERYCNSITFEYCGTQACLARLIIPDDGCKDFADRTNDELDAALRAIGALEVPTPETAEPTTDALDHPGHYNREGAMECIEEMLLLFGREETMIFCKLNAWKYRYRAADKGGIDDLKKSDRYLAKYKELKERTT